MGAKDIRVFGDEVVDVIDGSPEQVWAMIISIALVLFSYHYILRGTNEEILVSDLSPARVYNAGICMRDALHANSFICQRVEGKGIEHVGVA